MNYYYGDSDGNTLGPVPEEELHQLMENGVITTESEVAGEDEEDWTTYGELFPAVLAPTTGKGKRKPKPGAKPPQQLAPADPGGTAPGRFREYKVELVTEGGCGTILLGSSSIPERKLEAAINKNAAQGWQVVFQVVETRRMFLFWTREAVLVTYGR